MRFEAFGFDQLAEVDGFALGVGQLDADDVAAGNDGDADGHGAHGAGDVVGEADDARGFCAAGWFEFEQCDDGAGLGVLDFAFDAEVGERVLKHTGLRLEDVLAQFSTGAARARALEHR